MVVVATRSQIQAQETILEPTQSNHYLVALVILTHWHEDQKLGLEMMIFLSSTASKDSGRVANPFLGQHGS